jgi:hypothetical protein
MCRPVAARRPHEPCAGPVRSAYCTVLYWAGGRKGREGAGLLVSQCARLLGYLRGTVSSSASRKMFGMTLRHWHEQRVIKGGRPQL